MDAFAVDLIRHLKEVMRDGKDCLHPHAVDTMGHDTEGNKIRCACAACDARKFMWKWPERFPEEAAIMEGSYDTTGREKGGRRPD